MMCVARDDQHCRDYASIQAMQYDYEIGKYKFYTMIWDALKATNLCI